MARQVVWNKKAIIAFDEIVGYLESEVSRKNAIKFILRVDELISKLNKYPEIGRRTKNKKTVRQYKIDKHRKLYYRKAGKKLVIVFLFDERFNPKDNPFSR